MVRKSCFSCYKVMLAVVLFLPNYIYTEFLNSSDVQHEFIYRTIKLRDAHYFKSFRYKLTTGINFYPSFINRRTKYHMLQRENCNKSDHQLRIKFFLIYSLVHGKFNKFFIEIQFMVEKKPNQ